MIRLRLPSSDRLTRWACVLALLGLALMMWSIVDPTVWPIMIAISAGQAIGTLSFVLYLVVVVRDVRLGKTLRAPPEAPAPPNASP